MTTQEDVFARVGAVVAKVFNTPAADLQPSMSALDIDGWDSVSHAMLVLELEDQFKLRLDFEQTVSLENIGALADHIGQKLDEDASIKSRAGERVGKPLIIFFGNCQAEVIAGHLVDVDKRLTQTYDIRYLPS